MAIKIDLEEWFDYVILMRGKEYFLDDRVIDLKKTGLRYKAKVYGSRLYNVNIIVDKYDEVVEMECDCPYACENYCKHMAATVYSILDDNCEFEEKTIDYKQIINRIPKKEIEKFLIERLQNSQELQENFKDTFFDYFPKFTKEYYLEIIKKEMEYAINNFSSFYDDFNYDNYYDSYEDEDSYSNTVSKVIEKYEVETVKCITKNDFQSAYNIATALLESLPIEKLEKVCEYYDSIIEYAVNECVDDFKKILMKDKTKSMQNMIFEYCLAMLKDEDKVGFLDNMIGFLLEDEIFDLDTYLDKKIELLKEIFPKFRKYNGISNNIPKYVKKHVEYLNMLGREDEALIVIKENIQSHDIFDMYIDILLKGKNYDEAIKLLKAEIKKDDGYRWKYNKWSDVDKLLDIYSKCGKKEEIRNITENIIYNERVGDVDYFKKLKETYTVKEWEERKKVVIKNIENLIGNFTSDTLRNLYVEEKMYDKLFISVMAVANYGTLLTYESYLKPDYEKILLEKYKNIADRQAKELGRRSYEYLQEILIHMKSLKRWKRTCK